MLLTIVSQTNAQLRLFGNKWPGGPPNRDTDIPFRLALLAALAALVGMALFALCGLGNS